MNGAATTSCDRCGQQFLFADADAERLRKRLRRLGYDATLLFCTPCAGEILRAELLRRARRRGDPLDDSAP
jgi:hypothetical protein